MFAKLFRRGASPSGDDIDPGQAIELMKAGAVLVDVRDAGEFAVGRSEAAVWVPLQGLVTQGRSALPPAAQYLFVCRSGNRSREALKRVGTPGQDKNVAGGMKAWAAAGLPMVADRGKRPIVA